MNWEGKYMNNQRSKEQLEKAMKFYQLLSESGEQTRRSLGLTSEELLLMLPVSIEEFSRSEWVPIERLFSLMALVIQVERSRSASWSGLSSNGNLEKHLKETQN